jgi:hypothetical protein
MAKPHPLQQLYDQEIHFKIETFWDGGFEVALVDPMNGYMVGRNVKTFDQAVDWLVEHAEKHLAERPETDHRAGDLKLQVVPSFSAVSDLVKTKNESPARRLRLCRREPGEGE